MSTLLSDAAAAAWTVVLPLVDAVPDPDDVKPGPIAALIFVVLMIATILLWLNMRKQLGKISFDRPNDPPDEEQPGADEPLHRTGDEGPGSR